MCLTSIILTYINIKDYINKISKYYKYKMSNLEQENNLVNIELTDNSTENSTENTNDKEPKSYIEFSDYQNNNSSHIPV